MIRVFSVFLITISILSFGQNNTPTYSWRMHLPYNSVRQLMQVEDKLYVLADIGIYTLGINHGELGMLTKVEGFAESEVACMGYSEDYNTVVIVYRSGNIDLLKDNSIINIPGIKRSPIVGLKKMNGIKVYGKYALIATSFGVVVLDVDKEEITDDYQNLGIGGRSIEVSSLAVNKDTLFLGTTEGLKYAPAFDPNVNLKNFSSWNTATEYDSIYLVEEFNGKLYFVNDSILYHYDNGEISVTENGLSKGYRSLRNTGNNLMMCRWEGLAQINKDNSIEELGDPFMDYVIRDDRSNLWFGGFYRGLIKVDTEGNYSYATPEGPYGIGTYDMMGVGKKLYVTSGGHTTAYAPIYNDRGYYVYEDGDWTNSQKNTSIANFMLDLTNIFISQDQNDIWLGSFGTGLLHLDRGSPSEIFDKTNSSITEGPGDRVIAFGMAEDSRGNLWVANYETSRALAVRRADGSWEDFNVGTRRLGEMVVDRSDQVWSLVPRTSSQGIMVTKANDDGSIQTPRFLGTGKRSGGLPDGNVKAIAADKDDEIWVGTETGLAVFYNPSLVFDGGENADAQQIIIDDGNDVGYLLGNEVINDIKVDGANRKWIATNNGAWLLEEDGGAVLMHFTEENSPLPSNIINTIGIIPGTGEVFFGTKNGIASFRGDATESGDMHSNTLVFPNPVDQGYDGPITITGLPENATVKIADVAGRVVYELIANGGTAVWDGRSFSGEKPQTGVYLIFSANENDEESLVSKLLIVR